MPRHVPGTAPTPARHRTRTTFQDPTPGESVLNPFVVADHTLTWRNGQHILTVQPWGADSVRVRAGLHRILDDLPGALGAPAPAAEPGTTGIEIDSAGGSATLVNGRVRVEVAAATGLVSFHDTATGAGSPRRGAGPLLVAGLPALRSVRRADCTGSSSASPPTRTSASTGSDSTATGGSTRRAWSSSSPSATARCPYPSSSPAAATACCGTTRRSDGWSSPPTAPAGSPTARASSTTG